ncbi:acidic amino acid decarboxylase GADL1-like [Branchiostoma floridae]|uniref:Acidic amino acid decarboxylase GADL1-like n=1 Tax=Branchiostoma floridae TaxID=7739 RepID=A0A9J7N8E4_BRAFL|nr:acidic amino acid decarboxylase GADL1-like [Branchiostoma floridae]
MDSSICQCETAFSTIDSSIYLCGIVTIDLELRDDPEPHESLLDHCKKTIQHSVKTGHPMFLNQLYQGMDPYGLAGQFVSDSLNTNLHTFEAAPVFVLMEQEVVRKVCSLIGWPAGDGLMGAGGSMLNMFGINLARHKYFPDLKKTGMHGGPRLVLLTSAESHYSMTKGAGFLGIGTDNVIKVKCDERGQMLPEELDKAIEDAKSQGSVPFCVNATSGTTVTGGYDPLGAIADVCQKHRLWLHVDAAWGGSVLTSRKHRGLMAGVERADSLLWNPHKMLSLPLQCSVFVTREQGLLKAAHASGATYLFQKDKISYDASYDVGDKSIQCGRKTDPMKFWLSWKAHGTRGFEQHVDYVFELAQYLYDKLISRKDFKMVLPGPNCTNVCFWYIPPSLQGMPEGPEFTKKLDQVAPVIKDRMTKNGNMMVQYQPLDGVPNFFRLVLANTETTRQDLDFFVEEIERLGADL